ncbi:MAG: NAD(P) transhydrogenase subunit alpha [Alphaproteobacteria bacterium]|jgi:NAD(P) transhydrogenase subunit alpha|nr:NAD(P) transhydrogenase subunit alpha [Alphaproteobacteria bacterium]MDP7223211.1 NAD(P) transhydrogenase subunit alpha [Alphaproteobacteria bacterium]
MSDTQQNLPENAAQLANAAKDLSEMAATLAVQASDLIQKAGTHGDGFIVTGLTVFVLACFVGYYVVWRVTPALHSPLMGVTNAISSVIIVGALISVGASEIGFSKLMGFMAVVLASVNIFGGFIVTRRMLHMFKKK